MNKAIEILELYIKALPDYHESVSIKFNDETDNFEMRTYGIEFQGKTLQGIGDSVMYNEAKWALEDKIEKRKKDKKIK